MNCVEKFEEIYRKSPDAVAFCPYRICPIGAHSDHQHGRITGLAIDRGISLAYHPKRNGVVELASLQFDKRAQFHIRGVPEKRQNDWADYLRGATIELSHRYTLSTGLCGVIEGSLPIGGLSSSAAVTIAFLSALCRVNGIVPEPQEMIAMAMAAENNYVGVSCGKLDQSCEIYCRKDKLLYLDTRDGSFELIPGGKGMKPFEIAVFFSGMNQGFKNFKGEHFGFKPIVEQHLEGGGFRIHHHDVRRDSCSAQVGTFIGYGYSQVVHACVLQGFAGFERACTVGRRFDHADHLGFGTHETAVVAEVCQQC